MKQIYLAHMCQLHIPNLNLNILMHHLQFFKNKFVLGEKNLKDSSGLRIRELR